MFANFTTEESHPFSSTLQYPNHPILCRPRNKRIEQKGFRTARGLWGRLERKAPSTGGWWTPPKKGFPKPPPWEPNREPKEPPKGLVKNGSLKKGSLSNTSNKLLLPPPPPPPCEPGGPIPPPIPNPKFANGSGNPSKGPGRLPPRPCISLLTHPTPAPSSSSSSSSSTPPPVNAVCSPYSNTQNTRTKPQKLS